MDSTLTSAASLARSLGNAIDRDSHEITSIDTAEADEDMSGDPFANFPEKFDNHTLVAVCGVHFTKFKIIRVHLYDSGLYLDSKFPLWGKNITMEDLRENIAGHGFSLTKV